MCGLHQRKEGFLAADLEEMNWHLLWGLISHNKPLLLISAKKKNLIFLSRTNTATLKFSFEGYFSCLVLVSIVFGGVVCCPIKGTTES